MNPVCEGFFVVPLVMADRRKTGPAGKITVLLNNVYCTRPKVSVLVGNLEMFSSNLK